MKEVSLIRVIDGDTYVFDLDGHSIKVRGIGFDCPELNTTNHSFVEAYAEEATEYARQILSNAKIMIRMDKQALDFEDGPFVFDRYGRLLCHIYVDGSLLSESLIGEGLARVVGSFPIEKDIKKSLNKAQVGAKSERLNLWSLQSNNPDKLNPIELVDSLSSSKEEMGMLLLRAFLSSVIMSKNSNIIHAPGCTFSDRILDQNKLSDAEVIQIIKDVSNARACKKCGGDEVVQEMINEELQDLE